MIRQLLITSLLLAQVNAAQAAEQSESRFRAREAGLVVGVFEPGVYNSITDVGGVLVGHETVIATQKHLQYKYMCTSD